MDIRKKRWWPELPEDMPIDVMPASNGEFIPPDPTAKQIEIMRLQNAEAEVQRRRLGMSRRDFVRTTAAYGVGFWAINQVMGGTFGRYASAHNTETTAACDLEWQNAQMNNLPGEFIFDVQSHHVESDGMWRVTNPDFEAFFAAIWGQAGPITGRRPGVREDGSIRGSGAGEIDPIENLSRYHYLKELYLDSSTNMCVLSAVPAAPDLRQPLPIDRAATTVETVNRLAGDTPRCVMHAFVMPNRGSAGTSAAFAGKDPLFMEEEFELMERRAVVYRGILRGWKTYPAWGDVPYASGWYFDDDLGMRFIEKVLEVSRKYGTPPVIASHKGFALPAFDQRGASPRDIGPAARAYPAARFVVYHSGYDGDRQEPYAGDNKVNSADRRVDALIKSLRENGWDASHFVAPGMEHGNVPNVYAEIGSTWRSVMNDPNQAAHLIGKLVQHVGPRRVVWGTDSLWFGSPQSEIVAFRSLQLTAAAKQIYNLPHGLEGDRFDPRRDCTDPLSYTSPHPADPTWPVDGVAHPERSIRNGIFGRNAAEAYEVDPDAIRRAIDCDDVQKIRDGYYLNQYTMKENVPLASNTIYGPRTRRELFGLIRSNPWGP